MWFKTAVVILALLAPVVGFLQVQSAQQAADLDRERRQRQLESSMDQMILEFSGDLARALGPARFRGFGGNSGQRRLVRTLYRLSRLNGDAELSRWNADLDDFEPAGFPESLAKLRNRSQFSGPLWESELPLGYVVTPGPGPGPGMGLGMGGGPPLGPPSTFLAELDLPYLQSEYFPGLRRKYFPSGEDGGFQIQVADLSRGAVIWDTAGAGTQPILNPDSTRPMLPAGGGPRFGPRAGFRQRQGWELRARHSWGSLDAVVQASFHRSLILRLGLVSLASFALFALLWTAYREKELAARQMDFVAGVSHELRTPLAVICSAGENLADGVALKQGKVEQYGSLVRDEGRRLSEMVEQILAFSKTEGNHETEPVPLSKLVQRAMTACTHEIRAAGAEVDVYIPEELPPVIVDPTPMAYAIRNLLSNAIRHGKSPIYMTAHPAQRGVDFSVEDQGEGIDPREAKKLFEPFYRGQTARATQVRGLGLGLSLVKRIVESQGGRVRAENRSEGGARFILTLPT